MLAARRARCDEAPTSFVLADRERVVKRVLICRHGQGFHNQRDALGHPQHHLVDPELTSVGVAEARAIFADTPPGRADFKPDVVLVSPLWRTLQTATEAMSARTDGHRCAMVAMEEVREHNTKSPCNHRRAISAVHATAFPSVDVSGIDVIGPAPAAEWLDDAPYKASFAILRARAERALAAIDARPEECIAVFCHATFSRALLSAVMQCGPHHAAKPPRTGEAIEVWRIETPSGERYWELGLDGRTGGHELRSLAYRNEEPGLP